MDIANKFLESLPGKIWFGVWIDILAKEKFVNLSKNFLFLFSFVSYLSIVYFIFLYIYFYFRF